MSKDTVPPPKPTERKREVIIEFTRSQKPSQPDSRQTPRAVISSAPDKKKK
jgi:hypothetical protein